MHFGRQKAKDDLHWGRRDFLRRPTVWAESRPKRLLNSSVGFPVSGHSAAVPRPLPLTKQGAQSRRSAPAMVSSEQSFSPDAAGEVVVDQLPAEAAKDRRACRASRPRPHFPVGRGRGQRPEGACHPCRHPLPSSATAMDVNAIQAKQNESGTAGLSDVVNNKAVGPMPTPAGRYELPNSGHSRGRWHLPMRETLV